MQNIKVLKEQLQQKPDFSEVNEEDIPIVNYAINRIKTIDQSGPILNFEVRRMNNHYTITVDNFNDYLNFEHVTKHLLHDSNSNNYIFNPRINPKTNVFIVSVHMIDLGHNINSNNNDDIRRIKTKRKEKRLRPKRRRRKKYAKDGKRYDLNYY